MGVVWLATDEVLDRKVAVKEVAFPPGLSDEERDRLRRRTMREARTNARLNHPNVVGVYDIVEEEGRPWIVMEFVPSRSLAEIIRADGPLSPRRAAEIGLQLLQGLCAAHAAGVLHRDVKPSNVLLADDGRVVLGDFGIATAKDTSAITSSGVLIGSPSYMAPERARGREAGPESDLWSLGATVYAAVEGRPPFERASAVATLAALVMDDPDTPEHAGPLWPLIRALLRRDPAERPSSEEVARTLREVAGVAEPARAETPDAAEDEAEPEPEPEHAHQKPDHTVAAGTSGTLPHPARPGTLRGAGGRSPAHPRRILAAVLTVAVVLAVVLVSRATGLIGGHQDRGAGHAGGGTSRRSSRPSASASSQASSRSPSVTPTRAPTTAPTAATGPLPAGYHWHHDDTGFSIAVPDGWSASHHGHYLYVEDPRSSRILIVDQTDTPKSDPLADWREQEAARRGGLSGYSRIRLESVDYPQARKAADWEFTYNGSGGRVHVINRNILANSEHAYALYWSTPDSRWKSSRGIFDVFAATFRPARA